MSEPSEKELRKALSSWRNTLKDLNRDSESTDYWNEEENGDETNYKAIRRIIEERGELEKQMSEWKGRAKEIMDELDTDDSSGALLEDIRNFGKEGR